MANRKILLDIADVVEHDCTYCEKKLSFGSQFAAEVYKKVKENGHEIVGVFTVPDSNNREDPVAAVARYAFEIE